VINIMEEIVGCQNNCERFQRSLDKFHEDLNQLFLGSSFEENNKILESIEASNTEILDLKNCMGNQIDSISNSLDGIQSVISQASSGMGSDKVLFAMGMVLLGSFSAFLLNIVHSQMTRKKDTIKNMSVSLKEKISSLDKKAFDYWITPKNKSTINDELYREIRIQRLLKEIRTASELFVCQLNSIKNLDFLFNKDKNKKKKYYISEINKFNIEIFDLITGEDFGSDKRCSSKVKASKICRKCSDVSSKIEILEDLYS